MTDKYAGHTPGPWECDGSGAVFVVEAQCCGRPSVIWGDDGLGNPVYAGEDCCGSPGPVQTLIAESSPENARLIADAPLLLKRVGELEGALEEISQRCPPYTGEYSIYCTPSDFGNSEDYAREVEAQISAHTGDIARAALNSDAPLSIGEGL